MGQDKDHLLVHLRLAGRRRQAGQMTDHILNWPAFLEEAFDRHIHSDVQRRFGDLSHVQQFSFSPKLGGRLTAAGQEPVGRLFVDPQRRCALLLIGETGEHID